MDSNHYESDYSDHYASDYYKRGKDDYYRGDSRDSKDNGSGYGYNDHKYNGHYNDYRGGYNGYFSCHPICRDGCNGYSEYDCNSCTSNARRNSSGACECDYGWMGDDCSLPDF
jgi:hypothetical protein